MHNGIVRKHHWDQFYSKILCDKPGWYTPHLHASLCWIDQLYIPHYAPIIDIGGGESTFAEDLVEAGFRSVTVLDISGKALTNAQERMGRKKRLVTWQEGDVASVNLPVHYYELWHDRAAFHYFTREDERQCYRESLFNGLKPGGHLIIGTYAPEAPPRCSGLPVRRYTVGELEAFLGDEFVLQRQRKEQHVTPNGKGKMFLFCHFQRRS